MGEVPFWLARYALVVAGAAFLCYILVIVILVAASHVIGVRRGQGHSTRAGGRAPS